VRGSNEFNAPGAAFETTSILAAPIGPLTLSAVSVTTHQLSISVPLR